MARPKRTRRRRPNEKVKPPRKVKGNKANPKPRRRKKRWPKSIDRVELLSDFILAEVLGRAREIQGVDLSDAAVGWPVEAVVVKTGPGYTMCDGSVRPISVSRGDVVLHRPKAGAEVKIGGEKYVILREPEVISVINKTAGVGAATATAHIASRHDSLAYISSNSPRGEAFRELMGKSIYQTIAETPIPSDNPNPDQEPSK